ncbi:MAG: ABC transporter permease [Clostridiales bacterium]|nr:ABC transporter permease [Clostridiales bacterium]
MRNIYKKILSAVTVLIGVTFLSFLLSWLSPSDPAAIRLSQQGTNYSEELLEQTREEMGLNDPFLIQYASWLRDLCRLDLGTSFKTGESVAVSLGKTLPKTIALTCLSLAITACISIPAGILCARKPNGIFDNCVRVVTYLFSSLPSFFLSLLVLYVFAVCLGWFHVVAEPGFRGMILPACVLGVMYAAWYTRQIRGIALEQTEAEYVRALRCRGVSEFRIYGKHILKNCMLPIITLLGITFGSLLGGSAIVEMIFSYDGVGKLAIEAVSYRDYPVIRAYALWMAILFLAVNFLTDILYSVLDPRVRRDRN